MLGKTAGAVFWMCRYLERCENMARLVEAGFYIALTRSQDAQAEWESILNVSGNGELYHERYEAFDGAQVVDFLLRDVDNPSSVRNMMDLARSNARLSRTALTREVWEAINDAWMNICAALKTPITNKALPEILSLIRQQAAFVQGALQGSMLRNDIYDFARLGTFIERANYTARILDVKYYVLLPTFSPVGSAIDNVQWETILRAVSAQHAYGWVNKSAATQKGIADFLILDTSMPRSMAYCAFKISQNLRHLEKDYKARYECHDMIEAWMAKLDDLTVEKIINSGLHEFLQNFLELNTQLAIQIETDYRFYG